METTLAILMALGIFVGIPAVIGFAIAGVYILSDRRIRRTKRIRAMEEAVGEHVKAHGEAIVKEWTKEHVPAAKQ